MTAVHFILPGDPETRSGGFIYDRRVIEGLRDAGWRVETTSLPDGFPDPSPTALDAAERALAMQPAGALIVIDGLALGVMPEVTRRHAERLHLVGLVHHPLADETGLAADRVAALLRSERDALQSVRRVIVTSPHTAARLADFDVEPERISVATPGVDETALAKGSGGPGLALLCAASLIPRKGHTVLIDALSRLADRPWHLTCAGSLTRDPVTADSVRAQCERQGLSSRVSFPGEVKGGELDRLYRGTDLFVLASFHEGYGMVLTEALARGLPIVAPSAGAIPDTLPDGTTLLVPPGDATALAEALGRLMDDEAALAALAHRARAARADLPRWDQTVTRFAAALRLAAAP